MRQIEPFWDYCVGAPSISLRTGPSSALRTGPSISLRTGPWLKILVPLSFSPISLTSELGSAARWRLAVGMLATWSQVTGWGWRASTGKCQWSELGFMRLSGLTGWRAIEGCRFARRRCLTGRAWSIILGVSRPLTGPVAGLSVCMYRLFAGLTTSWRAGPGNRGTGEVTLGCKTA